MIDRNLITDVPTPEAHTAINGLPASGTSSGGLSYLPEAFSDSGTKQDVWGFIGDCIGAACIFFMLFVGLFAGIVL